MWKNDPDLHEPIVTTVQECLGLTDGEVEMIADSAIGLDAEEVWKRIAARRLR